MYIKLKRCETAATIEARMPSKSFNAYDEKITIEYVKNESAPEKEEVEKMFELATDKTNQTPEAKKARWTLYLLPAICVFSGTTVTDLQFKMYRRQTVKGFDDNPNIQDASQQIEKLWELGLLRKCLIKKNNKVIRTAYSATNFASSLAMKYQKSFIGACGNGKLKVIDHEKIVEAWALFERNALSQLMICMLANGLIESMHFDNRSTKINTRFKVKFGNVVDDPYFWVYCPRTQPGWEAHLARRMQTLADKCKNNPVRPKLILCAESPDMVRPTYEVARQFADRIDVIYTDDLSAVTFKKDIFSCFDKDGNQYRLLAK